MNLPSPISAFFARKTVLITGATGFMGKVLLQKLLTSAPDLQLVFVLIRPKKSLNAHQRLHELFNSPLYDSLRQNQPDFAQRIVPIEGDITESKLGISDSDRQRLINEVNVVFHTAATVKFDEQLKLSITINVMGTKQLIELSRQMLSLEVFVHVSTAYCNCDRNDLIMEKVYSNYTKVDQLISLLNHFDDGKVSKLIDDHPELLLGNKPNTYTFTKALTECWLDEHANTLPICIVRPSIVIASYSEPIAGWVDNWNGPNGIVAAASKGIFRTMLCDSTKVADLIPVDYVINLMFAAAHYTASLSNDVAQPLNMIKMAHSSIPVFNCCSGRQNPITWSQFIQFCFDNIYKFPSSEMLWYPSGNVTHSRTVNSIKSIFVHVLPAVLVDCVLVTLGKKAMMTKIRRKLENGARCLEYFSTREWHFDDYNTKTLYESLSPTDQKLFNFNVKNIDWSLFIKNYVLGIRKFLFKESDKSLSTGRKLLQRKRIMHRFLQTALFVIVWKSFFPLPIVDLMKNFISFLFFLIVFLFK